MDAPLPGGLGLSMGGELTATDALVAATVSAMGGAALSSLTTPARVAVSTVPAARAFVDAITAPSVPRRLDAEYVTRAIPEPGLPSGPSGSVPENVTVVLVFSHPAAFSAGETPSVEGSGLVRSTFTLTV